MSDMTGSGPLTVNRNVELKDIPIAVDKVFSMLSAVTGKTKVALYREALIEYAENHKKDLADFTNGLTTTESNNG